MLKMGQDFRGYRDQTSHFMDVQLAHWAIQMFGFAYGHLPVT